MTSSSSRGILDGYRVIDCSIAQAGPFAAQRLGDLGADVIKIEPPAGEWQRHTAAGGATGREINVSFLSLNRNKRSLAVDLKRDEGRELVQELIAGADVFLQNYRPGVAARLGLDYETIKQINPSIVYVSISGYGEDGPYRDRPGQDMLLQAMTGSMLSGGRDGEPPRAAGLFLADGVTASTAFEGALAALLHRERTGEGQHVSVNMLDALTTLQMQELSVYTVGGVPQRRGSEPNAHVYIRAPYGVFATSDGYIALAFADLDTLGRAFDEPDLRGLDAEEHGWTHRDELFALVSTHLARHTTAHWLDLLLPLGVWVGPVYGYEELVADPQVLHNGTFVEYDHPTEGRVKTPGFPYRFDRTPARIDRGAPRVGEHSREILDELGIPSERASMLLRSGAIAEPPA